VDIVSPPAPVAERTEAEQKAAAAERERLLLLHMPQVRLVAESLRMRLRFAMEFEDLMSYGTIGLIKAIERFDPGRGVLLKTYAEHRIRGAILDGARAMDWLPRSVRQKERQYQKSIRADKGRQKEASASRRCDRRPVGRVEVIQAGAHLEIFEQISQQAGLRGLLGNAGDDPEVEFQRSEIRTMLAHAVSHLPNRHRTVLRLYYGRELSMKRIGQILRIHESRVSQLHAAAIGRLQAALAPGRGNTESIPGPQPKLSAQPPADKASKYFVTATQSSSVSTPMVSSAVSAT
jgi:RNA polymerase sigma factor for flagellar operon FliA